MRAATAIVAVLVLVTGAWFLARRPAPRAPSPASRESVVELPPAGPRIPLGGTRAVPSETLVSPLEVAAAPRAGAEVSAWNGDAIRALESGDHDAAIAGFERCREAAPAEGVFAANLAEALVRRALARVDADPAAALADLERAIALAPERAELPQVRERWQRIVEAQADFALDLSEHFALRYDGDRDDLLGLGWSRILDTLERAWHELREYFDGTPNLEDGERIAVVLYEKEQFTAVTGLSEWAGGAFDGTLRVPVEDFRAEEARLERVLRHELVHAFLASLRTSPAATPGWLNEGLAQFLESEYLDERARAWRRAQARIAGSELFPLARLEGTLSGWQDAGEVGRAYEQALAFTGWLESTWGERTIVAVVRGEGPAATTFQERTGVSLADAFADFATASAATIAER